VHNTIK